MITEKYIKYNINSKDKRTTDCVARAISTALDKNYNDVHKALLSMRKAENKSSYKIASVYGKVINQLAGQPIENVVLSNPITVRQFCEDNPNGTYILHCKSDGFTTGHLCAVINGDLYDTWNSSKWVVTDFYEVPSERDVVDVYTDEREDKIENFVQTFSKTYSKQIRDVVHTAPNIKSWWSGARCTDPYTIEVSIGLYDFLATSTQQKPTLLFKYPIKISLRETDVDTALDNGMQEVLKSLKCKLYEYNRKSSVGSNHNSNVDVIPEHDDYTYGKVKSLTEDEKRLISRIDGNGRGGYYRVWVYTLPDDEWYEKLSNGFPVRRDFEIFGGVPELHKWLKTYIKSNGKEVLW